MFCLICLYSLQDPQSNFFLILEFVNLLVPELALTGCYCWFGQQMKDWVISNSFDKILASDESFNLLWPFAVD